MEICMQVIMGVPKERKVAAMEEAEGRENILGDTITSVASLVI